jgi:predicted alpha/beta-hydrolase family hydrolase
VVNARLLDIATPVGTAQVDLTLPERAPSGVLVLGHGAGGGIEAPDLLAVTAAALREGVAVARVLQPYRVLGRRAPAPARQLDAAWEAVCEALRDRPKVAGLPLVTGGRSSGSRVACRTASAVGARGVLALAFPLHPPGRPERSRLEELASTEVPVLVVQGERDTFGTPAEFPAGTHLVAVPGADHALKPRRDSDALEQAATEAASWVAGILAGGAALSRAVRRRER